MVSIPFALKQRSLGDVRKRNVQGTFDGPFAWENAFGLHLSGVIGHDFYKSHALTFDFNAMRLTLDR